MTKLPIIQELIYAHFVIGATNLDTCTTIPKFTVIITVDIYVIVKA
jgi:hypothetical protein